MEDQYPAQRHIKTFGWASRHDSPQGLCYTADVVGMAVDYNSVITNFQSQFYRTG